MNIERTESGYTVCDSTGTGNRITRRTFHWETKWSLDLEFQGILLDGEDALTLLRDKENWLYHRVKRAKNRHLGALQEKLGRKTLNEGREIPIYTLYKSVHSKLEPIADTEGIIHPKTVEIHMLREKKGNIFHAPVTPERAVLVSEYNQKLEEFIAYQKEMMTQIFGKDQVDTWED